jgi:hypothetical protein
MSTKLVRTEASRDVRDARAELKAMFYDPDRPTMANTYSYGSKFVDINHIALMFPVTNEQVKTLLTCLVINE